MLNRSTSVPLNTVCFIPPSWLIHHGEEPAVAGESRKVAHVPLAMRSVHKLMAGEMAVTTKLVAVVTHLLKDTLRFAIYPKKFG